MTLLGSTTSTVPSQTLRLFVSYVGKEFCGFSAQKDGHRSVEVELKNAIAAITRLSPKIVVAGRTDAGVHADGQVVSLELATPLTSRQLTLALATKLPPDMCVWRIDKMPLGFDARRQSVGKRYLYEIYQGLVMDPFFFGRALHVKQPLDIKAMQEAASYLMGEHDFSSFRASGCDAMHARRNVWYVGVEGKDSRIIIDVRGNAFCLNMVRIMVGTLLEVGRKRRQPIDIKKILADRDRKSAGVTAKPYGLRLNKVYYPDDLLDAQIPPHAVFPRYPVSSETWPFSQDEINYGPM